MYTQKEEEERPTSRGVISRFRMYRTTRRTKAKQKKTEQQLRDLETRRHTWEKQMGKVAGEESSAALESSGATTLGGNGGDGGDGGGSKGRSLRAAAATVALGGRKKKKGACRIM